ncbi:hypothetical protein G6F60_015491 [Rhizopus arrhizus]|nr:hypothetical protein G6F60_015491 [Rhizopus arrhizus]
MRSPLKDEKCRAATSSLRRGPAPVSHAAFSIPGRPQRQRIRALAVHLGAAEGHGEILPGGPALQQVRVMRAARIGRLPRHVLDT